MYEEYRGCEVARDLARDWLIKVTYYVTAKKVYVGEVVKLEGVEDVDSMV